MISPELTLKHPVELGDGTRYERLKVKNPAALHPATFRMNTNAQLILSLARVFGVSRRAIKQLDPIDLGNACDLCRVIVDEAARTYSGI
jgi:hypothetical protein